MTRKFIKLCLLILTCRLKTQLSPTVESDEAGGGMSSEANYRLGSNQGGSAKASTDYQSYRKRESDHLGCEVLGKLRLPRSLLEKWVEEPFFEKAVVGCFVRLGVGLH